MPERRPQDEILEHGPALYFAFGPDQVLRYVSAQAPFFFDCSPEEAEVPWSEFLTEHPGNAKGLERRARALATGERQPPFELELRSRGGRRLWVEVHETPVMRDGRLVSVVGSLTDVTQRRRREEQRTRFEDQFRQAQKMDAVGRLAGGVAHDFNNLLGVILGYAEMLRPSMLPGGREARRLGEIAQAAQRAAGLTKQLLALSRKQVLDPQVVDLATVARELEPQLRGMLGEDIRLELRSAAELWAVMADRSQLQHVLMDLASNAKDAMPEGGVLAIELVNVSVGEGVAATPTVLAAGRYVRITVSDSGRGMDPSTRAHLFEPFFTTKPKGEGSGLSLAMAYGIVRQSGGTIDVLSTPGHGSTFTLYLPAAEDAARTRAAHPSPGRGRGTLLLVEDEEMLRRLTREVLEAQGYTVIDAGGGTEALNLLAEQDGPPDLLLTDVVMPGINGPQLAQQIRRQLPHLPVLFMTGYSDEVLGRDGAVEGAPALLKKPFTPEALLRAVDEALWRRK
jgi:two-component system, cell cycle sensor histidine kinase and response regulator CckA